MYAKLRFTTISATTHALDAVCALFESQATTVAELHSALNEAVKPALDQANSFITTSKSPHGWTVDYVNSPGALGRTVMLKAPCKNSNKFKYAVLANVSNVNSLTTGQARTANTLADNLTPGNWYSTSILPGSTIIDIHVSSSARHLLIAASRVDTGALLCSGVFEFVTNDGFYTESSPYIPVALAFGLDSSVNFSASTRVFRVARYKNMRANGYPDVTAQSCYWETPYSEDEFSPADNGGYDFLGNSSDRTPLLVPFGVCNRKVHAFQGGAISDLCDIYLGPIDVGGNYEETIIGTDSYISIPIASNTKRLFVPKG